MKSEKLYWVWLSCRLGVANPDFVRLILRYENPYDIYMANAEELSTVEGVSARTIKMLSDKRLDEASDIIGFCAGTNIGILAFSDAQYPNRLRLIQTPPVVLYVRGKLPDMNNNVCIGMVGTRKMSEYGREYAYRIGYELGAAGAVVVSGMALGVDGVSACGAISGGGKTVAVLGCGIDVVYPREHAKLMNIIAANGAVVTEYSPGTPPIGAHFPVRNRIISGMCNGTLIVEADMKSGAMITANLAVSQGRQLFAIPGNLGESNSEGTNKLIRDGAIIVIETEDILDEYEYLYGDHINNLKLQYARANYSFGERQLIDMGVFTRVVSTTGIGKSNKVIGKQTPVETERKSIDNVKNSKNILRKNTDTKSTKELKNEVRERRKDSDNSEAILASLDPKQKEMFEHLPFDRAMNTDELSKLGYTVGEVMAAMTMLEIKGLVSSLPGGLYIRK